MGFNLRIGEAVKVTDECGFHITAKFKKLENAPADGVPTDYTNERWPSYTGWTDFYESVNLKYLFEQDILKRHPGFIDLTFLHKEAIDRSYEKIKLYPVEHQVRLEWLKFWIDWALANCKRPVFYNS